MSDSSSEPNNEQCCRVCSEPMGEESGHTHDECHDAAKEEFAWYP